MSGWRAFWKVLRGLAGELSDENAYRRYLFRQGVGHSPGEWRKFSEARFRRKYGQAKCC